MKGLAAQQADRPDPRGRSASCWRRASAKSCWWPQDSTNYGRDWAERDGLADAAPGDHRRLPRSAVGAGDVRLPEPRHGRASSTSWRSDPRSATTSTCRSSTPTPTRSERMRRPHRPVEELVGWIRSVVPDVMVRTTFITGFPGETEAEHRHAAQLDRDARLRADRRVPVL